MSLFDRRSLLICLVALAGCGFTPVYGPGGAAEGLRGAIEIADPTNRDSYALVKELESRLGQPMLARFQLTYQIKTLQDDLAITPSQEITRYNVIGEVEFAVWDIAADTEVYASSVNSFTSYSATGTTVSTKTAELDAYDRLMVILADQITSRLLATSGEWYQ